MRLASFSNACRHSRARLARLAARRWGAALAISLLLHAAIAGAAWSWRETWDVYLLDPQAGRTSIAMTASFAAQPEASSPEFETGRLLDYAAPEVEKRDPTQRTDTSITRSDAVDADTALRLVDPVEPVIVLTEEAARPVVVGGMTARNKASREPPPPIAESATKAASLQRQFAAPAAMPSAASIPALPSVAMSGVEAENGPKPLVNPPPFYPPEALAAGRTGRVIVRAEIAADGSVNEARLRRSSGAASLDAAAVSAVRQWQFSSAEDSSAPPRLVDVPIDFVIRRTATRN